MLSYGFAFDLDTKKMKHEGLNGYQIHLIYSQKIPNALRMCGFTEKLQQSFYCTGFQAQGLPSVLIVLSTLKTQAPNFCRYVKVAHIVGLEDWGNVTNLFGSNMPYEESEDSDVNDFEN